MKRWNAVCALCAHLYDRYLRGVNFWQMGKTLVTFYGLVVALLLHVSVPGQPAAQVAAALTAVAAFIYLIIPKSRQALADNLLADAATHQAQALEVEDKVIAAVGIRASVTASVTASVAASVAAPETPSLAAPPATILSSAGGEGSDDAPKP